MNLFIDTISKKSTMILFDNDRNIVKQKQFEIKWNESSLLIPNIDNFLKDNNIEYFDLENIVLVNGPWSFTWVRTSVLAVNTINYITKKDLTWISYFDLYRNYPIIKTSSKRDCFVKLSKEDEIKIINNDEIKQIIKEKNIDIIYWDALFDWIQTVEKIDFSAIIKDINFQKNKKLEAMYIKKPNIC